MSAIITNWVQTGPGTSRPLELLSCTPTDVSSNPPILFVHGAYCSAHDYQLFLPEFASRGYAAYALSCRGHGNSWAPSGFSTHILTSIDDHVLDIKAALYFVRQQHASVAPPIVAGHSFGGSYLQYLLAHEGKSRRAQDNTAPLVSGLVLLGAGPLSGGWKQIVAHWEEVETKGKGYDYPWSPRSQLETAEQVRAVFFHASTAADAIETWRTTCRTKLEGIRSGVSVFRPVGEAADVLAAIGGLGGAERPRKVFCVAAELDVLVMPDMVVANAEAYEAAVPGEDTVARAVIAGSGHYLMMDSSWRKCADEVIRWVEG